MQAAARRFAPFERAAGVAMSGSRNNRVGRQAAIVAADRVKLLLAVVEDDAFLSEVLHSANKTISINRITASAAKQGAQPNGGQSHEPTPLGPAYHAAKSRSLRAGRSVTGGRSRPQGRA